MNEAEMQNERSVLNEAIDSTAFELLEAGLPIVPSFLAESFAKILCRNFPEPEREAFKAQVAIIVNSRLRWLFTSEDYHARNHVPS